VKNLDALRGIQPGSPPIRKNTEKNERIS